MKLLAGESLVLQLREHWIAIVEAVAVGTTAYVLGLSWLLDSGVHLFDPVLPWTWIAAVVVLTIWRYGAWRRNYLAVTDQRIIVGGWAIPLDRIEHVDSSGSALERLADAGTVTIALSDGSWSPSGTSRTRRC